MSFQIIKIVNCQSQKKREKKNRKKGGKKLFICDFFKAQIIHENNTKCHNRKKNLTCIVYIEDILWNLCPANRLW